MKKLFRPEILLALCWTEVILQVIISLLQLFVMQVVLDRVEIIIFALIIIVAAGCYLTARPALKPGADVYLLLFMLLWFFMSCIGMNMNSADNWFELNASELSDMEILILTYLLGKYTAKAGVSKSLMVCLHSLLITWSAVMLYILINIFMNRTLIPPCGGMIGMYGGSSFQINCNRNYTGALSMVFLLMCFCMITAVRQRYARLIYGFCFIVHYFALVISCSRTGLLSAIIGFAPMVSIVFYTRYTGMEQKKRIAGSTLAALFSGGIFFLLRYPVYQFYSLVVSYFAGDPLAAREIIDESIVSVSSRLPIWEKAVGIIFSYRWMLTGVTPAGVAEALIEAYGGYMAEVPHCHNLILQVGVSLGIPGLVAFLIWLFLVALRCLNILTSPGSKRGVMLVTFIILAIMADNMAERYSMFYMFFISYPFFFTCGYVMGVPLPRRARPSGKSKHGRTVKYDNTEAFS